MYDPKHYNVYVVELSPEILKHKKVLDKNKNRDTSKAILYVGSTGLNVEERFKKHKDGLKANSYVQRYGLRLRPELYTTYNPMTFDQVEAKEIALANELRSKGYTIVGGDEPPIPREKKADWTEFDLKRHQERVAKRMADKKTDGLVVAHGMGSGKTLSSIATYKKLGLPTTVVPPAALVGNYEKEIHKWLRKQPKELNIESQQRAALKGLRNDPKNGLLIVDEAHKAREGTSKLLAALKDSQAKKRMLLTGTPIVNHPRDLATLVNFVANKDILPEHAADFNKQYFKQELVEPPFFQRLFGVKPGIAYKLQNKEKLKKILDKYVDYHPSAKEGFPSVKQEEVKVPMGKRQMDIYKTIMGQAPWWVRMKVKAGLPPGKGELDTLRAFLGGIRQVSNTTQGFTRKPEDIEGPKIENAFNYLQQQLMKDPSYKAVVYSNYLNSGLNPYKQYLTKYNIPYGEFSGNITPAVREKLVKDYNANKLKALLISSAGAEGLDLKGTRLVQLLEPHFNEEKEKQIIGRGARYLSHAALPPDKQNLLVQRYLAKPQASFLDKILGHPEVKGADEYIRQMAIQKDQLNRQVMSLMSPEEKKKKYLVM